MDKTICELFAGVGGFRLGFERLNSDWDTVWFSQWEPNNNSQWAYKCYKNHFGDSADIKGEYHNNEDIATINKENIPNHSLLVGGFPCQDYSVAATSNNAKGLEGNKGVLWWQIYEVLKVKRPPFCLFENVDRLLKSPSKQKGRDFGIILSCLNSLGYSVEWRVINSASYGSPQRRKRVFLLGYHSNTNFSKRIKGSTANEIISHIGVLAKAFPNETELKNIEKIELPNSLECVSNDFQFGFESAGCMQDGVITTVKLQDICVESQKVLREVLEDNVEEKYYLSDAKIERFKYLKGAKRIPRVAKDGHKYIYSEGGCQFPDSLDRFGRTVLTSEGSCIRSTHVISDPNTNKLRYLTPLETERLQGFDDNWTGNVSMPDRWRYFCMGNALVVPMITRIGEVLDYIIKCEIENKN